MEEIQIAKSQIREEIAINLAALSAKEIAEKTAAIENRLFDFANFLESKITLLYVNNEHEVLTENIIKRAYVYNKIVVLPAYNAGATPVRRYGNIPPYRETRDYVRKVMAIYRAGSKISITKGGQTYTIRPGGKTQVTPAPSGGVTTVRRETKIYAPGEGASLGMPPWDSRFVRGPPRKGPGIGPVERKRRARHGSTVQG